MFLQWEEGKAAGSAEEEALGEVLSDIAGVRQIFEEQLVEIEHLKKEAAALIAIYGDGWAKLANLHRR